MAPIMTKFPALLILILLNYSNGAKEWEPPKDGKAKLVTNDFDNVETIQIISETQGLWEIGNGEIWHKPIDGEPKDVTRGYEPIPAKFIADKMAELKGGSIRTNKGAPTGSIRQFDGKKYVGDSIRKPDAMSDSIRTKPTVTIDSIRKAVAATSGSIRSVPKQTSTRSIRTGSGIKNFANMGDNAAEVYRKFGKMAIDTTAPIIAHGVPLVANTVPVVTKAVSTGISKTIDFARHPKTVEEAKKAATILKDGVIAGASATTNFITDPRTIKATKQTASFIGKNIIVPAGNLTGSVILKGTKSLEEKMKDGKY